MIKKTLATAAILLVSINTFASTGKLGGCNFVDHMHISAPAGTKVLSLTDNNGGAATRKVNDAEIDIVDNCNLRNDPIMVTATIGTDDQHNAKVVIEDGQLIMNPSIVSSNSTGGYFYSGMDHPFGSYDYTLKFQQQ